ncbi:MAG: hypothetical protein DMF61_26630 [Blastocatellia bacterium AA13]|nr:MAG: hypothetical protein DMF61_26630 [Blastocatellia bacterium AA13]
MSASAYSRRSGMSDAFNSSPATIGGLLASITRERIVVPTFQRGYMWKKKHVEAFWDDVDKQRKASVVKGADPHFLGPIVTLTKAEEGLIWILDGQQRLATATILFSVIRDAAREIFSKTGIQAASDFAAKVQFQFIEREEGGHSLELGQTDALYFKETIQLDPPTKKRATILTHRNIRQARERLMEKVIGFIGPITPEMDSLQAIENLRTLKKTLVSDLVMARLPVTSQEAAFKIFVTLNDRGLRLSTPDLLLSYLMEKAPDGDRTDIRNLWTEMIQRMGTHDIDRFMRHMWVSSYGDLKNEPLFTALKNHIEAKHITSIDFARLCGEECENYIQLVAVDEEQLEKGAVPFVRALTRELNFQPSFPLLLSSYLLLQRPDFAKIAQWLLVFVTRYSIIGNQDSAGMEDLLYKLAREVRHTTGSAVNADVTQLDKDTSARVAKDVRDSLALSAPDNDAVKKAVERLTLDHTEAKYVMSRLARYKQDPTKAITLGDTNVEHIYPQNPEENEWGGIQNQEVLDPLVWHIGNLTIFGRKANRKAENKEFPIKRPRYEQSPVIMTKEIAGDYNHWDENTIKDRAKKLAKVVVEVWNFDNTSRV